MHLTAPSHWSQSPVTGGRDASERVVTIVVARSLVALRLKLRRAILRS